MVSEKFELFLIKIVTCCYHNLRLKKKITIFNMIQSKKLCLEGLVQGKIRPVSVL